MLPRLVRALRSLRPADWRDLLAAEGAVVGAQLSLWRRPTGSLLATAEGAPAAEPTPDERRRAAGLALAVRRAVAYGPVRPLCLGQAIALHRLLERRGLAGSRVRVGVRRDAAKGLAAHAWVEYGGEVLGDDATRVAEYSDLADFELVNRT